MLQCMEYFWFVVIGLVVGLVVGQFLEGNNFGIPGDVMFGIAGSLAAGIALAVSGLGAEGGVGGRMVMAAMGAGFALFLRRVLKVV
jgi:uncharacterized membrane protein YeaQ/YmgE (transglycosylase-associated protein family)